MPRLIKKKSGSMALPSLILMLSLSACGTMPAKARIENAPRPAISPAYEKLLRQANEDLQREAMKHEWDWRGYADKMEDRNR